jgi:hypothetical protein
MGLATDFAVPEVKAEAHKIDGEAASATAQRRNPAPQSKAIRKESKT